MVVAILLPLLSFSSRCACYISISEFSDLSVGTTHLVSLKFHLTLFCLSKGVQLHTTWIYEMQFEGVENIHRYTHTHTPEMYIARKQGAANWLRVKSICWHFDTKRQANTHRHTQTRSIHLACECESLSKWARLIIAVDALIIWSRFANGIRLMLQWIIYRYRSH